MQNQMETQLIRDAFENQDGSRLNPGGPTAALNIEIARRICIKPENKSASSPESVNEFLFR